MFGGFKIKYYICIELRTKVLTIKNKKMEKKVYFYGATEENGYELCKVPCSNVEEALKALKEDLMSDEECCPNLSEKKAEKQLTKMRNELEKKGYTYAKFEGGWDKYTYVCGLAYHGKTSYVTERIKDERREFIAMCG